MSNARTSAPVVGFNHNVKYAGRVYHVQTEDSGRPHSHYITHLFVGGNVVASMKTSYADREGEPDLAKTVRSLMEGQHKAMLKRLVAGEFDDQAERLSAPHYEPGVLATGQTGPAAVNTSPSAPSALDPSEAPTPVGDIEPVRPPPAFSRPPAPKAVPPARPAAPALAPRPPPAAQRSPAPPVWQAAPPGASTPPSPRQPGAPLPSTTRLPPQPARPSPPKMTPVAPSSPRPFAPRSAPPAPRAPPPSLFADQPVEAPHEDLPTLFAEELISEKSLDEVILAFLSADLEPPK